MSKQAIDKHFHELNAVRMILEQEDYKQIILSDSPDVVVEMKDGRFIGIEVVDCVVSSIRSDDEQNRVRVINNIKYAEKESVRRLRERGEKNISIDVSFTHGILDTPKSVTQKQFADKFFEEIERHRKNDWMKKEFFARIEDDEFREEYRKIEKEGGFKYDYIESIECFEHPSIETNVYHLCCFCFSDDIIEDDINECLKIKEPLLKRYEDLEKNSGISEYWLAIWVPSDEHVNFDNYEQHTEIESKYQRIYMSYPFNACKRLK